MSRTNIAILNTRAENALERYLFKEHNHRWEPDKESLHKFIISHYDLLKKYLTYPKIIRLPNVGKKSATMICTYLDLPHLNDFEHAKKVLIDTMKYHEYDDGIPKRDVYKALKLLGCTKAELDSTGMSGY